MKSFIKLLLLLVPVFAYGQWTDDFSSGNLNNWNGDTVAFVINSKNQLNLNASVAGEKFIYRVFSNQKGIEWNIYEELQFSPSSSNKLRIYLNIDTPDLLNFQGYFLEVGESGNSDNWKLIVQNNSKSTILGQGELAKLDGEPSKAYFNCSKKNDSIWLIRVDYQGGTNFTEQTEIRDSLNLQFTQNYFGIHCFFTATRIDKFIFDDISVKIPTRDTLSPSIININAEDSKKLKITFDEKFDTNSVKNTSNYTVTKLGNPSSIQIISQEEVILTFIDEMIADTSYCLSYFNIADLTGNIIAIPKKVIYTAHFFSSPKPKELIISEFMSDPDPAISLPNVEYIELYNNSSRTINLADISISDGNTNSGSIKNYSLSAHQFLILCASKDTQKFMPFGNVIGLTSMPSFNNDGDQILLYDKDENILDHLQYQLEWHTVQDKRDGGYSLELQFVHRTCKGKSAWGTTINPLGGTPGKINSLWNEEADIELPKLNSITPLSQWELQLSFDDVMDENVMKEIKNYIISPTKTIANADLLLPGKYDVVLLFNEPLESGVKYHLTIGSAVDCSGNEIVNLSYDFEIPSVVTPGQLLFNEILFNPNSWGVDYLEVFNNSDLLFSTQNIYFSNSLKDSKWLSVNKIVPIPRKSYLAFTSNPGVIQQEYPVQDSANIKEGNIPSIDDDRGFLKIAYFNNGQFVVIDSINFSQDWHNPLIVNKSGVALEKINPKLISNNKSHWTSASKIAHYGTPGLKNSQYLDSSYSTFTDKPYQLESLIVSPNQDGVHDQLIIYLKLDKPGYKANFKVFDLSGNEITIINQNVLGTNDILTWNVFDQDSRLVPSGNYILDMKFIHTDGEILHFKQRIIVDVYN